MSVSIETKQIPGATVVKLIGDSLEADNVASFRSAMAPVLDRSPNLVLDLSNISFMDSTGLGAMLSCLRTVKAKGGNLKLTNLTAEVRQLFEMVLMDRVFEIE